MTNQECEHCCPLYIPCSIVRPRLIASLEAQAGKWAQALSPVKPGITPDTEGRSECWTHPCVCVFVIVFSYQGVHCVYVWWPSAGVPIGNMSPQISRCWGLRGRGEGYWLNDLRPRLCSRPKECRCSVQRDTLCGAFPPAPFSVVRYWSAPEPQPNVMF